MYPSINGLILLHTEEVIVQLDFLLELEQKTGLSRICLFYIILAGLIAVVFFGFGAGLICDLIGVVYPAYATFQALEMARSSENELGQMAVESWLIYWFVWASFELSESLLDTLLSRIPLYYLLKITFVFWSIHERSHGAQLIYHRFLKPFLRSRRSSIESFFIEIRAAMCQFIRVISLRVRAGSAQVFLEIPFMKEFVPNVPCRRISEDYSSISQILQNQHSD